MEIACREDMQTSEEKVGKFIEKSVPTYMYLHVQSDMEQAEPQHKSQVLSTSGNRLVFRRALDSGALQQTDLDFVSKRAERSFSKAPKPKLLKVGMKLSYYTEDEITEGIKFNRGDHISEIGVFYLKSASDCRRLLGKQNISEIIEHVMESINENIESFLCFCALDVSFDMYF